MVRTVCQLTGAVVGRPSRFFEALSVERDRDVELELLREENAALRCRLAELEGQS